MSNASTKARIVYVGTYSAPHFAPGGHSPSKAEGIYVYSMEDDGRLSILQVVQAENPSFLAVSPTQNFLYCVNELGEDSQGGFLGSVSSYKIDPKSGRLSFLNTRSTMGTWPCHCSVHPSGTFLLAANYGTGSFVTYPIKKNGRIGHSTELIQCSENGTGPDNARQSGSHAHMICTNPGAQHVFGTDLGSDKIFAFELNAMSGELTPGEVPFANTASGSGPRHLAFHPSDENAYVLKELSSTIDTFAFDAKRGSFLWKQTISSLPEDTNLVRPVFDPNNPGLVATGGNTTAAIEVHPSGKWIYATNRGMNTVVKFGINPVTGTLCDPDWSPTYGLTPRGMQVDPSGSMMVIGNQDSDSIVIYDIDPESGALLGEPQSFNSPTPVAFAFGPLV